MLHLESNRGVRSCDGLTRRDFLRVGSLAVGIGLTDLARLEGSGAAPPNSDNACIQLFLIGGPSQLDTWDLKPDAPVEIRGPFRPMRTNVPGIQIGEHFPLLARRADRYAIVRSVYHEEAPIHETGHQLLQTGRLFRTGVEWPHAGAVLSRLHAAREVPPWAVVPGQIGNTGVSISHGQGAGFLGSDYEPVCCSPTDSTQPFGLDPARLGERHALVDAVDAAQRQLDDQPPKDAATEQARDRVFSPASKRALDLEAEPDAVRRRYGGNTFGQSCLLARRLVQAGVRLVTVNMFDSVFNRITWDCHANGGDLKTTLDDYRTTLCPMFDTAYSALLDDLEGFGLLSTTFVLAAGEFGRTPRRNARGGRDHWPGVWSILAAGGGVRGGQVIGASDAHGAEPRERPVHVTEVAATVYHTLGIDPRTLLVGPDGTAAPLVEAEPIRELF